MKLTFLLLGLLPVAGIAAEPPAPVKKLVPRPIPGLELPLPEALVEELTGLFQTEAPARPAPAPAPATAQVPQTPVPPAQAGSMEQARVVYIHRRATLPAKYTQDLPKAEPVKGTQSMPVQVSEGTVKIIPKSEVGRLAKTEPRP